MDGGTDSPRQKPIILLVEDEALVRQMIGMELEDTGFHIIEAADGREAVAVLQSEQPVDLLFTDIRMPGGIDGWQLGEQARALKADLPVIYATGYTDDAPRLVPGALLFKKPYKIEAVIEAMKKLGLAPVS